MAKSCARCGRPARALRSLCVACSTQLKKARIDAAGAAARLSTQRTSLGDWYRLLDWGRGLGFPSHDVFEKCRPSAQRWLSGYVDVAVSDGYVTDQELVDFDAAAANLPLDPAFVSQQANRIRRAHSFGFLFEGNMPSVESSLHLPSDEICHLEEGSTRVRHLRTRIDTTHGVLVATNRKMRFSVAMARGAEIPLTRITRVHQRGPAVIFEITSGSFEGEFHVRDSEWVAAVCNMAAMISQRRLVRTSNGRDIRSVPHHVKIEVWNRDGGRCVQCGAAEYLELDHIIPYSQGGATSAKNLQLLCRRCNLDKGARI